MRNLRINTIAHIEIVKEVREILIRWRCVSLGPEGNSCFSGAVGGTIVRQQLQPIFRNAASRIRHHAAVAVERTAIGGSAPQIQKLVATRPASRRQMLAGAGLQKLGSPHPASHRKRLSNVDYSILHVMSELLTVRCDRALDFWIAGTRASSVDGELPWRSSGRAAAVASTTRSRAQAATEGGFLGLHHKTKQADGG